MTVAGYRTIGETNLSFCFAVPFIPFIIKTYVSVANCFAVLKLSIELAKNLNRLKFCYVKYVVFL